MNLFTETTSVFTVVFIALVPVDGSRRPHGSAHCDPATGSRARVAVDGHDADVVDASGKQAVQTDWPPLSVHLPRPHSACLVVTQSYQEQSRSTRQLVVVRRLSPSQTHALQRNSLPLSFRYCFHMGWISICFCIFVCIRFVVLTWTVLCDFMGMCRWSCGPACPVNVFVRSFIHSFIEKKHHKHLVHSSRRCPENSEKLVLLLPGGRQQSVWSGDEQG